MKRVIGHKQQLKEGIVVGINRYQIVLKDLWSRLKKFKTFTFKKIKGIIYKYRRDTSKWDKQFHKDKNGNDINIEK